MVYEPKPLQLSVMMLFFSLKKIFVTMQKIDLNKHFSSGCIQEIEAHEGPYASCFQYSAFAGSGSLLLMRGFQIFAKRK